MALPLPVYARLQPDLQPVVLRQRQMLYDSGDVVTHVYFPVTAVVSLLILQEDGTSLETALVGREGLVGLPVVLGSDQIYWQAMSQIPGTALRVPSAALRTELGGSGALRAVLDRYTEVRLVQLAQGAACNRLHSMTARCARWLLEARDRVHRDPPDA